MCCVHRKGKSNRVAITYSSRATAFVEDFETLDVWICLVLIFLLEKHEASVI